MGQTKGWDVAQVDNVKVPEKQRPSKEALDFKMFINILSKRGKINTK
jgi:hypothetical protein